MHNLIAFTGHREYDLKVQLNLCSESVKICMMKLEEQGCPLVLLQTGGCKCALKEGDVASSLLVS